MFLKGYDLVVETWHHHINDLNDLDSKLGQHKTGELHVN